MTLLSSTLQNTVKYFTKYRLLTYRHKPKHTLALERPSIHRVTIDRPQSNSNRVLRAILLLTASMYPLQKLFDKDSKFVEVCDVRTPSEGIRSIRRGGESKTN